MWYVYESHLSGSLYLENEYLDYEDTYCEQCGDSDSLIDSFQTKKEAVAFIERCDNENYY